MGGDSNAAHSRCGYAQSTSALYDKVNFFQDFVHFKHGTLIESEAHTRRDLLRGSSTSLDHIITWNLTCTNACTMQRSTSKVLTYRKGQVVGGRPGELKLRKIDPKQLPLDQLTLQKRKLVYSFKIASLYGGGAYFAEDEWVVRGNTNKCTLVRIHRCKHTPCELCVLGCWGPHE